MGTSSEGFLSNRQHWKEKWWFCFGREGSRKNDHFSKNLSNSAMNGFFRGLKLSGGRNFFLRKFVRCSKLSKWIIWWICTRTKNKKSFLLSQTSKSVDFILLSLIFSNLYASLKTWICHIVDLMNMIQLIFFRTEHSQVF